MPYFGYIYIKNISTIIWNSNLTGCLIFCQLYLQLNVGETTNRQQEKEEMIPCRFPLLNSDCAGAEAGFQFKLQNQPLKSYGGVL